MTEENHSIDRVWDALALTVLSTVRRTRYATHTRRLQQFIAAIPNGTPSDQALMRAAIELLYSTHGQVQMCELAAHCCLSLRQFERRFKQLASISPKTLARLIRFESIRDRLLHDASCRLIDLAYDFGYSDQSHFIHDFKTIAAFTPGEFVMRATERRMANFYYAPDPRRVYHGRVVEQE